MDHRNAGKAEFDPWAVVCQAMLQLKISEAFFDRM